MILVFELSMPQISTWNNRWSGEGKYFAKTRSFQGREQTSLANEILDNQPYRYDFGDGWGAMVKVRHVDSNEAAKVRRKSDGFMAYDWMIDSIIGHRRIHPDLVKRGR